ncbi:MAG: isochorismatase family protein [Pseudomonadota bacterium]
MVSTEERIGVIVTDIQGDFTEWKNGSLSVPGTDKAFLDKVHEATERLERERFILFATQDWHPKDHVSFYPNHPGRKAFEVIQIEGKDQILWPPHCVQGTANAKVLLDNNAFLAIVKKGQDPRYDSYSGFQDDGGQETEMDRILKRNKIKRLVIYGIATDYCVKATATDAKKAGYDVIVIKGLSKGVSPDTTQKALDEMKSKGITILEELDLNVIRGV